MNFADLMTMGIKNLLRRKTRSILAIMGVIIGTCAITVMVSLGIGLSSSFEEQIKSFGNLHTIDIYSGGGMVMDSSGQQKQAKLDDKAIADIAKLDGVTAITPIETAYMKIGIGKYVAGVSITGVDPEVFEKFGYELREGRNLAGNDKYAILFGRNVPMWFYNPYSSTGGYSESGEPPVDVISNRLKLTADQNYGERYKSDTSGGEKVDYIIYDAQGIGILENENDDTSYTAYMNIETVKKINEETAKAQGNYQSKKKEYTNAKVYVEDIDMVKSISTSIKDMGLQSFSLNDMLDEMKKTSGMIQAVLGGIGAVSMLVAALGISNTMIMSIYERTKEIGIMKVIGANIRDIKYLFLFEAAFIGFLGGRIGLILSYGLSYILNTFLGAAFGASMGMGGSSISIIPVWLALSTLAFSTGIGVLAGYLPAKRAMNLSALESLRNE